MDAEVFFWGEVS